MTEPTVTTENIVTRVSQFATAVGTEMKGVKINIGNLTQLDTTHKTDLVGAINEVKAAQADLGSKIDLPTAKAELIKDTTTALDSTYSSTKIEQLVTEKVTASENKIKTDLIDGASGAYDTLKEIEAYILEDKNAAGSMLDALNNRLRIDEVMQLNDQQKNNVFTSLGLTAVNFTELFNNAMNS